MTPIERADVDAEIRAAVGPIVTELKWQRWCLIALAGAVLSPKLGGPTLPELTTGALRALGGLL